MKILKTWWKRGKQLCPNMKNNLIKSSLFVANTLKNMILNLKLSRLRPKV